jgi:peroxiredoxin
MLLSNVRDDICSLPHVSFLGCSKTHCPSFVRGAALLKGKGVDLVACTAVNDCFVLDAWSKSQFADGKIQFLADGNGDFAKKVGMVLDLTSRGLGVRSKRYALIVENGVVKHVAVDETGVEKTTADALLPKL